MTIKNFLLNIIFWTPVLITYLLYMTHKNGDGSGLVLYGKPNQTLGIWLFMLQVILTLLFSAILYFYKNKAKSSSLLPLKTFLFLTSLGVPIFINDWLYCGIICYIATFLYTVVSACIFFVVLVFSIKASSENAH